MANRHMCRMSKDEWDPNLESENGGRASVFGIRKDAAFD